MQLGEADYDVTARAFMDRNQNSQDDKLMIKFEMMPHFDEEKSTVEGRPIYYDREYITIIVPGDKNSVVHRPVWAQDKQRFSRQYQAFKAGQSQDSVGLPLKLWPAITLSQAKEFEYFNVKTVEQLAGMSDGNGIGIQGFNGLKQRAVDYLEAAAKGAPLIKMRAELESRDNDIATLRQALQEQGDRMSKLEKLVPKSKLAQMEPAEEEDA